MNETVAITYPAPVAAVHEYASRHVESLDLQDFLASEAALGFEYKHPVCGRQRQ
jgi:hypothetical protein